jgi:hypothetical protein
MWQHQSSPLGEAEIRAMGHVAAPEPTSAGRWGSELRDTWQRWSSPQQGGEVWGSRTRGCVGAHLGRQARSGAAGHVAAWSSPQQRGEVWGRWTRGITWMYTLLLVLT